MQNQRENWIDSVRGFVIVIMLIGHAAGCPATIRQYIYGFHMPFFFMLSGYLFDFDKWKRRGGLRALVKNRLIIYVIPYFILSVINLFINIPLEIITGNYTTGVDLQKSTINHFLWILYNYRTAITSPNCTPLWFLIGLFVATIYFYGLLNIKKISIRFMLCVVGFVICSIIKEHVPLYLPWHIDSALVGMSFMYVGYIIKTRDLLSNELINWLTVILFFVIGSYSIMKNTFIDVNIDSLGNIVLFFVGAVSISYVLLWIFRKVIRHNSFLEYLGKNTIVIIAFNYAINSYSKELFNVLSSKVSFIGRFPYSWWMMLIVDIIISLVLIFLWRLLKSIWLKSRKNQAKNLV